MSDTAVNRRQEAEAAEEAAEFAALADAIRSQGLSALDDYVLEGQTREEFAADILEAYPPLGQAGY